MKQSPSGLPRLALLAGLLALWLSFGAGVRAQALVNPASAEASATGIERWLLRLNEAARERTYIGTFVVTAGGDMSSSRIWHVGEGGQQLERVESLTGTPRTTFRRDDEVVTFLPDSRTVVHETREALGLFPNLLNRADASVTQLYRLKILGTGRVAGLQADMARLLPLDNLRFGYQIWVEPRTGLLVKLQTLDAAGNVLEQAAFSDLQLDAPVAMVKLKALMDNTRGYRVQRPNLVKTTIEQEGWALGPTVPGFAPVRCYKRQGDARAAGPAPLQCVFTDGLASVSLFIEPFDWSRHTPMLVPTQLSMGATHVYVRQSGTWWMTAVGEVPTRTLATFVQALERVR